MFALPLYDDNPARRAPVVNYLLIGLCIGAFFWELGQNQHRVVYGYAMIPAVLFGRAHLAPYLHPLPPWVTIFTSMFLHGGWFHLIGNMLFLWIFGHNVEDELGHFRYIVLYLASGVAAALIQGLSDPGSHVPMIGASGAIAGVLGAYAVLSPRANVHVFVWIVIFFRIVNVPAWILLGLWFAMQLISGVEQGRNGPGVAFWAHVGGFVAGMLLLTQLRRHGTLLLRPQRSAMLATTRPRTFLEQRRASRGSVPSAGRPYRHPANPWDRW
ncbi:MAG: rhomboid family intramembrane serine protease [Alphaproteobacteria bacterium]|nr:rhomboid family intramembrane serine protease [Alphaproteobacteria bacterium]